MFAGNPTFASQAPAAAPWTQPAGIANEGPEIMDQEETDTARRPPNAFILYSQAMRGSVRQENPSLSNTEVSSLLGKMWKEVPNDIKIQYKQQASALQEDFKRQHPDYTYRKARRKRALNELLTKSTQGYPVLPNPAFPGQDLTQWSQMIYPYQMTQQQQQQPTQQFSPLTGQQPPAAQFPMGTYQQAQLPMQNSLFGMAQYPQR